jgi:hypothetical protein
MANLMPGAELGLKLQLSAKDGLEVYIEGLPVKGVPDRVALLRAAHGKVADFLLNEIFDYGENDLRERIGDARLILVRSQEIDEALESDKTAAAWSYIKGIQSLLTRGMARLAAAGVSRFVIASDHGFLILSRALGPSWLIDPPGGRGELHRRCWIGKGGVAGPSTLRVALADLGVHSDLDLVVPRGLAIFSTGGARRFFHGGLSPQEIFIPVIEVRVRAAVVPGRPKVKVQVVSNKVTTGVFSAVLTFEPDLFTPELRVRLVVRNQAGEDVARVVAGDSYDEAAGMVTLRGATPQGGPQVVMFRVTSRLHKGDRITLEAYDVDTDRPVAKSQVAEVPVDVRTGDELD